jgi:hypothetical protein
VGAAFHPHAERQGSSRRRFDKRNLTSLCFGCWMLARVAFFHQLCGLVRVGDCLPTQRVRKLMSAIGLEREIWVGPLAQPDIRVCYWIDLNKWLGNFKGSW